MSKKTEAEREKDEDEDLEDEEGEGHEDEDDEEHESPAASAKGHERRARARARAADHHGADDHGHGHDHDDEEDEDDTDDPYWWTPHAVLGVLVTLGILGFFGVFNKALGRFAAHPAEATSESAPAHHETTTAKEAPAKQVMPTQQAASPKPAPPVPDDVKAPPANATKTPSGLAYRVLKPGSGKSPKDTDSVTVNYTGWTTDGKMFDSSVTRGQPATFRLNQVIKGWTEGVQLMKTGETTRFWIPGNLAYGDKPMRPGAPAGMLVFDVELISVQ